MAGQSAAPIKAGQAYATLSLKDRMSKGLDAAKARFESFARGMGASAAWLSASGSLILGGLGAGVAAAMSIGSELTDVSDRTGVATDALSALQAVAEDTGASLNDVEAAMRGLSKFTMQVAKGSKQAAQVLNMLGINADQFANSDAMGKLSLLADALAQIKDPAMQSALAMAVLGKSGTKLLPMLKDGSAGLQKMIDDMQRLGVVFDKDGIKKADEMERQFALLKKQFTATLFNIGVALAEPLTAFFKSLQEVVAGVIQFVKANTSLVRIVAVAGLVLFAAGALLLSFAAAAQLGAFVLGGFTAATTLATAALAAFGTVIGVVKALLAPELLIVYGVVLLLSAALIGGVAAWMSWTESGQNAAANVGRWFAWLLSVVTQTLGGIFDAIMAGDWSLAFAIGVQGMRILWLQEMAALTVGWQTFVGFFQDSWAGLVGSLKQIFASLLPGVVAVLTGIHDYLVAWANSIAQSLGLEIKFDGLDMLKDYNAQIQLDAQERRTQIATETKTQIDQNRKVRDAKITDARYAVRAAQDDLTDLTGKAKRARDDMAAKLRPKVGTPNTGDMSAVEAKPGGVLGTFSASVAGLLGQSSPDIADAAKKTAENTGDMKDLLEDLLGKAEEGGLAFD